MEDREVMTPAEVATLFRVDPKTVTRWAKAGRLPREAVFWTPGGHRRYYGDLIRQALTVDGVAR